jgi:hypothetical protein
LARHAYQWAPAGKRRDKVRVYAERRVQVTDCTRIVFRHSNLRKNRSVGTSMTTACNRKVVWGSDDLYQVVRWGCQVVEWMPGGGVDANNLVGGTHDSSTVRNSCRNKYHEFLVVQWEEALEAHDAHLLVVPEVAALTACT